MSEPPPASLVSPTAQATPQVAPPPLNGTFRDHAEGLGLDVSGEEAVDRRLAAIEMSGEEVAAGWKPAPHQPLSPEVRYLHISRTIHELITDRNRSVGIFLAVASALVRRLDRAPERQTRRRADHPPQGDPVLVPARHVRDPGGHR